SEKMIADLDTQITNLSTQIEDRVKLYNLTMEERVRIANRVRAIDEAWKSLNIVGRHLSEDRKRWHARSTSSSTLTGWSVIMRLKRSLQLVLLLTALLLPIVVQAQAQAPTPAPSPVRSLSDNISALSQRAAGLLPYFDKEIVSKLMGWFELLAWVFGNCLAG